MKRNYCVQFFRYDGDTIVLWKQIYFEYIPSVEMILSNIAAERYDSVTISKVK